MRLRAINVIRVRQHAKFESAKIEYPSHDYL